jgi:signal peptidase
MTTADVPDGVARRRATLGAGQVVAELTGRVVLATVSALLFWSVVPHLVGWSSEVVVSGSMMPRVAPGDVVVSQPVRAENLLPGQVILVANPARPGTLLMHRMVSRYPDGSLKTKGDANNEADSTPVPAAMVRGLPRLRVPYVGLPMLWLRQGQYRLLLLTALVLLTSVIVSISPAGDRRRPADQATSADNDRDSDRAGGPDPLPDALGLPALEHA